jgi:hypothetical protein
MIIFCYIGLKWLSLYYIKIEIMKLTLLEMYNCMVLLTKKILMIMRNNMKKVRSHKMY